MAEEPDQTTSRDPLLPPHLLIGDEPIVLEGWLSKRSRHRGVYRQRWMVSTRLHLYAFREEQRSSPPTEVIALSEPESEAPSLHRWFCQMQSLHSRLEVEKSPIASLSDDLLLHIFEDLPVSAIQSICCTCRQWRDVRLELLTRQHRQATALIEHFGVLDSVYHLATLRRHRPVDGSFAHFTLHLEHNDEQLLRADRDREGKGFVITAHVDEGRPMQVVGHLVANASFTGFTLFDHGLKPPCPRVCRAAGADGGRRVLGTPESAHPSPPAAGAGALSPGFTLERRELAHVTLRHSMWAARCVTVALPAELGAPLAPPQLRVVREHPDGPSIEARFEEPERLDLPAASALGAPPLRTLASRTRRQRWKSSADCSLNMLHNAVPVWNAELRAFTLPFYGRVHLASKKNFQLIDRRRPENVVMIFGKSRRDVYSLDWCAPLSCLQALGVALSSFEKCISGKKR